MHISHNTFLKWKQILLQSISLSLSLLAPLAQNIPVSPLLPFLHPSLFQCHFDLAHRVTSFSFLSFFFFFASHLKGSCLLSVTDGWSPAHKTVVLWVVWLQQSQESDTGHTELMTVILPCPHEVPTLWELMLPKVPLFFYWCGLQ